MDRPPLKEHLVSYSEPPPPPAYGAPQPGAAAGNNSKALWSMILGILSLLCCSPLGIVAIILGRGAQAEIARTGQGGEGMAKAGFILGIIALVLLVLQIILFATGALSFDGTFETS
jgi:hypothetical protein